MIHGKNPTLLNVIYKKSRVKYADGKKVITPDIFEVVYKTEDGKVYKTEEPGEGRIYFVKPEYRDFHYNKPQERIDRMYSERVPISQIRYRIAEEIGEKGKNFVKHCIQSKDHKSLDKLYGWKYAFGCDFQPEFYFMRDWYEKYPLNSPKLTKAFLDIETEVIDYTPDLDNLSSSAYAPINAVTVILDETLESFTFILKPRKPPESTYSKDLDPESYKKRYELYRKQLKDHEKLMSNKREFIKDLHNSFDDTYGRLKYSLREYDEEIELIADVFRLIHDRKPNFCLTWNMRFDIQYMLERIKVLGYQPESIMCHPDFTNNRKCYFMLDRNNFRIENQTDYFYCDSYTLFICQMRLYAAIRKSQHKLKSNSLNSIANRELKDKKVEYPNSANMRTFPFVDWIKFIKYNIKDVLLQLGIERKIDDVTTYWYRSHSNLTPYNKSFRETHLLRNCRELYFEKEGCVQGNNINIIGLNDVDRFYIVDESDEENETTFKGAIMAHPAMNDLVGIKIHGRRSNKIFRNTMDYDMGGFYPSNKIISNMDPSTLKFKASFDNNEFISGQYLNRSLNQTYEERDKFGKIRKIDITGEAINLYASRNILTFGYSYLGLPDVTEMFRECTRVHNEHYNKSA